MLSPHRSMWSRVLASVFFCELTACSSLSQHRVLFLAWFHLATRSPYDYLVDEEVGLLVHHWFGVYLLYALVGSVTSHMDVAAILRVQSETR